MKFSEIILENRVDDFKNAYSRKYSEEQLKKIIDLIPQKFLMWVGKNFDSVNFNENFPMLKNGLDTFIKIGHNLPQPDINEYKNIGQLLEAIKDYQNKQRREIKKVEGGNVVYEDSRFFVVNPLTHQSSCYYGKGTKWCTAADTSYQFTQYNEDGKLFYILDKTKPTNDPHYKIAILQKFNGENSTWDAKDDKITSINSVLGEESKKILNAINDYLEQEYGAQLKIWRDKEEAKKEKQRLERLRLQRILNQQTEEAEERRLNGEWQLGPDCPEEGLKAHALLNWLADNSEVEVKEPGDNSRLIDLKNKLEDLKVEEENLENDGEDLTDVHSEIEVTEEEINEIEEKIDVYNIIPTGTHYDTTEFEVINAGLDGRRYAVGDENEMHSSCYERVEQLIDEIGYEGFNSSFARDYIDDDAVISYAEDVYNDDVYSNPEVYLDEDNRQLSDAQNEQIAILKMRIEQTNRVISNLEEEEDDEDESITAKIDELNDLVTEYEEEIESIESSPEGDFPDDLIEDKVDELVKHVRKDPEWFMSDYGLNWEDYIDKDKFIEGVIDTDGYGHTLNGYDGNADEVKVQEKWFYVMRID